MDEQPPTKDEPSAEAEHAPEELEARLRQLAEDSWAAYFRDRTEANLERANLLWAIGHLPKRRRKLAQYERRLAGEEAGTNPPHPDMFWRKAWLKLVRPLVADCAGDPETVARVLILTMPRPMRAKCDNFPTNEAELEEAVAAVVAARNFKRQVAEWHTGEQDVLKLARAVLRGLGMDQDDAKDLLRKSQCEAWLRERGAP